MKDFRNNGREYQINVNLCKGCSHKNKFKSYIFARYLDHELKIESQLQADNIDAAMTRAKQRYEATDFEDLVNRLEEKGWDMNFIFLTS